MVVVVISNDKNLVVSYQCDLITLSLSYSIPKNYSILCIDSNRKNSKSEINSPI